MSKIGQENELSKLAKIVLAEEFGRGNKIILSKIECENELRKIEK